GGVRDQARGGGMGRRRDPLRESAPPPCGLCVFRRRGKAILRRGGRRQHARRHQRALGIDSAAVEEVRGLRRASGIGGSQCGGEGRRFLFLQRGDLFGKLRVFAPLLLRHQREDL